ncbi:hypothetical protein RCL1_002912 [Eukaryota sp. TZLM3-RCL]
MGNPQKKSFIGLQKLKYYCQVCEKQCRDANAFDNHCKTEGHLRKMELFSQNQDKVIGDYSTQFERQFLEVLKGNFGTSKVDANHVYNLLIRDKSHVHLNATRWTSLSGFVQHLARVEKAVIEPHPVKGWWVQFIDKVAQARDAKSQLIDEHSVSRNYSERLLEQALETSEEKKTPKEAVIPKLVHEEEKGVEDDEIVFDIFSAFQDEETVAGTKRLSGNSLEAHQDDKRIDLG